MQNGCRAHFNDRLRIAQEWAKFPNMKVSPAERSEERQLPRSGAY